MVFLIQNTQNRDARAVQIKLDKLIRSTEAASDLFVDLEDLSDGDMDALNEDFKRLHDAYANKPIPDLRQLHEKIVTEHSRRHSEKH
jgi:low affinity Fe/Cu permease